MQGADLDRLRYFHFTTAQIGDTELVISRSGYTGELGSSSTPAEEAGALWDQLIQAGRTFSLKPYGVAAMHTLRLEGAWCLYGADLDESHSPFHVGLDRWVRFDKRSFIGREALLRLQERGVDERWVGLVLQGELPAAAGAQVYSIGQVASSEERAFSGPEAGAAKDRQQPGEQVGRVTVSGRGHSVGKTLAMAYVRTSHAWPGSRLLVQIGERYVPATVTPAPFFDPQGARLRAKA